MDKILCYLLHTEMNFVFAFSWKRLLVNRSNRFVIFCVFYFDVFSMRTGVFRIHKHMKNSTALFIIHLVFSVIPIIIVRYYILHCLQLTFACTLLS